MIGEVRRSFRTELLLQRRKHFLAVGIISHRCTREADDGESFRQKPVGLEMVKRGYELAVSKIARRAEDDDRHRIFYTDRFGLSAAGDLVANLSSAERSGGFRVHSF